MVASSSPLVASAYPPEGFRLMSDTDAVRAWLASFRGAIAEAGYADEMIEAGYDSLDNMMFTKDELQDAVASLGDKPGHAGRIARDAVKMVAEMGSVGPESPPEDVVGTDMGLGLADRIKMAGDAPPFPAGVGGKQVSRAQAEDWLDKEIVWARLWSKPIANSLVMRRDKGSIGIESIRAACRVKETHELYLGSTLLGSIQDTEKVHITREDRDRSMGLDMIHTLLSRYMKMNTEHIAKMHDRFTQQEPVDDVRQLSARMARWREQRQRLRNAGQAPTEVIQLGSLGKVMSKLKEVKAAAAAVEVIKGEPLDLGDVLAMLDNVADQVDMSNEDDNTKRTKPTPRPNPNTNSNPNSNPKPLTPSPIVPTIMQGSAKKNGRPCLHWVLNKLGGDCRKIGTCIYDHEPKMKGSDDPSALAIAKGIKCRNHPGCTYGDDCLYSHA